MALQTSGQISLNDIHIEVGGDTGTEVSLNDSDVRGLVNKDAGAQNAMNEYYGAANEVTLSNATVINGQNSLQEITVSDYVSSGGTLIVPTGWWIWSDNTANAAMTIDIPCTVTNNGKIIGKGGKGGWGNQNGQAGGPGIRINANVSGVTITNASGSYIAGGGGGGGGGYKYVDTNDIKVAGGGGGAGGGSGGRPSGSNGGALNATGGHIGGTSVQRAAWGGGAGGGGGHGHTNTIQAAGGAYGGGGGRILPGIGGYYSVFHSTNYSYNWSGNSNGHTTATGNSASGGAGGSAGGAGNNLGHSGTMYNGGGGGGGWGASGGRGGPSGNRSGGAGGKAIEDTGNTYTLTNNGTIYGATT